MYASVKAADRRKLRTPPQASPEASPAPTGRRLRTPSPPEVADPPRRLSPGDTVEVGGHTFHIVDELGAGAFGIVFEARETNSTQPLAVKLSLPTTDKERARSIFECDVLRQLGDMLPADGRVPKYVAHSAGANSIVVAMSKADGKALGEWLYGAACGAECPAPPASASDAAVLGCQAGSKDLAGATSISAALARQMAPVFSSLQGIAYHRDVSAHNFLVNVDDNCCPSFTMIDFGLAVDSSTWAQDWRSFEIGGDPRYWSPAAWMQFAHGASYLEQHQDARLRELYLERLDHYSFGVLLLETLFALWGGASLDQDCGEAMIKAQAMWRAYWARSCSLMKRVFGDVELLREQMMHSRELHLFSAAHEALCSSLRAAAAAEVVGTELSAVLLLAVELVDVQGTVAWEQIPVLLADSVASSTECVAEPVVPQTPSSRHRRTLSARTYSAGDSSSPEASSPMMPGHAQQAALLGFSALRTRTAATGHSRCWSEPGCPTGVRSGPPIFLGSSVQAGSSNNELRTGSRFH